MRLFLFGMQSSGASLATYLLGQIPDAVVLVDLYSYAVMPDIVAPHASHVIGKAVITSTHRLEDHVRSFRPDRSVLLLRDPVQNYVSLRRKSYADHDGTLEDKFRQLNALFRERDRFDLVLRYEDVVLDPDRAVEELRSIGFPATRELYAFPRSREEITEFNVTHCQWCRDHVDRGWSFGNIKGERMQQTLVHKHASRQVRSLVRELCPDVMRYYDDAADGSGMARIAGVLRDLFVQPAQRTALKTRRSSRRLADHIIRSLQRVRS